MTTKDRPTKLAEAQAQTERLLELLDGLHAAVYRISLPDGRYEYVSAGIERVWGYSRQDFLDKPELIHKAIHPNFLVFFQEKWAELLGGQIPPPYEYKIIDPAGNERWIIQSGQGISDETGSMIAIQGLMRNVSAQKQAQEEQSRLADALEKAVEERAADSRIYALSAVMLGTAKFDGFFQTLNPAWEKTLGYTIDELLVKPFIEFVHPDDIEATNAEAAKLAEGAQTIYFENRYKCKDGSYKWLAWNTVPHMEEELLYFVTRDITEQRQAEAEREHLHQELIEAQQRSIQELSTPVIPIMDRILVMPLVGSIDSMRAKHIMRTLLAGIRAHRAQVVILDITGVPIVDSGVAGHLDKTIQAAQLKGARTIVTGISDAVAEAIVDLGIDWNKLDTLSDLQTGLVVALHSLGIKLTQT